MVSLENKILTNDRSRDSSVNLVTGLFRLGNWTSTPDGGRDFAFLRSVQKTCESHSTYLMKIGIVCRG
jgi:hypothetical protein